LRLARFVFEVFGFVAEYEASAISARTKAALAAAKVRGTKLGGYRWEIQTVASKGNVESIKVRAAKASKRAADLLPMIGDLRANGAVSLHQIAAGLNERGIKTARGGQWSAVQVQRVANLA
jgi:DNA invertase Pin-like site-specific DNA recombinase